MGAYFLAYALRENKSIEHLWLNGNDIGSDGAEAIATALLENKTLQNWGLANNAIGNRGGKELARAMRQNKSITDICIDGNRMSQRVFDKIQMLCSGEEQAQDDEILSEDSKEFAESVTNVSFSSSCIKRTLSAIEEEQENSSTDTGSTQDESDEDDESSNTLEHLKSESTLFKLKESISFRVNSTQDDSDEEDEPSDSLESVSGWRGRLFKLKKNLSCRI